MKLCAVVMFAMLLPSGMIAQTQQPSPVQDRGLRFECTEEPRLSYDYDPQSRTIVRVVQSPHYRPDLYGSPKPFTASARITGRYITWASEPLDNRPGPLNRINIDTGQLEARFGDNWTTLRHCLRK
jgi:hypothetical protein